MHFFLTHPDLDSKWIFNCFGGFALYIARVIFLIKAVALSKIKQGRDLAKKQEDVGDDLA